jgi:S-formylglutathione hydrolase FrmB
MHVSATTRTSRRLAALVCGLVVAIGLATAGPASAGFPYGPDDLQVVDSQRLDDRLLELTLRTPAVEGDTGVRVLLPEGYDADPSRRYPVLFLLHGCCEGTTGFRSWTDKGDAARITAGQPLIVVMPDSSSGGGYVDWYNNGKGGPPLWETYHIGQLLPWVDQRFRTIGTREGRAVAGLSMGGFGTMSYAARHPDLFAAAASFSGAVNTNSIFLQPLTGTEGWQKGEPAAVHGPRATQEVRWRGANPWDLAENLDGLDLTIRTGNGQAGGPGGDSGDPIESEVHEESVSLHQRLNEFGIPHLWDDYGPGGHTWYYWKRDLEQLMPQLSQVFASPPPPPSPFNYSSIEPSYSVYGWRVDVDRPALEWSQLRGATRTGFALRGSGTGTVTTPPLYAASSQASVELAKGDSVQSQSVTVGDDCRLRLTVPLGPGNPYQQYTAEARAYGVQRSLETTGTAPSADTSGTTVYRTRVRIYAPAGSCTGRRPR